MTEGEKSSGEACVRISCDWFSGKTMQMHPIGSFLYAPKLKQTAQFFLGRRDLTGKFWLGAKSWQNKHERIEGNLEKAVQVANVKICRCDSRLLNYYDRSDLFGKTSERENLLQVLNEIGKIEVSRRKTYRVLPTATKIRRKYFRKITGLAKGICDFRNLCSKLARENLDVALLYRC